MTAPDDADDADDAALLDALRPELERLYTAPGRHYHDLRHVHHCLALFRPFRDRFAHPGDVELAIWFHDAVYDPTRADNEAASADLAADRLARAGVPPGRIDRVRHLILATRHDAQPSDPDARLLVDIDLAILGAAPPEFDAYEQAIRAEYAHVPPDAFAKGRAAILTRFLARPAIYATDVFRERFEAAARANLARSVARLTSGGA